MDNTAEVHVMPTSPGDYRIRDAHDAVVLARSIENAAKAIKGDLQQHQRRDAMRHSMELARGLVELQTWLLANPS